MSRDESADESTDEDSDELGDDVLVAEVDDPVEFAECLDAEESDTATVTWLNDVVFPEEQLAEAIPVESIEIDGQDVELPGAPAVVLPERVAQAGCIIEYDAPGGCLSAVDISGAYIPGYTLPGRTLPGAELPDGTVLPELVQGSVEVEAVEIEGVTAAQVCQDDDGAEEGDVVWGVTRWGETRWGAAQWGETVWGETRWPETTTGGDQVPAVSLEPFSSDAVSVAAVSVDAETLDAYQLDGAEHTDYAERDEITSYTTEADVLFDSDEHELRGDAESELRAIADDIAEREGDYVIEVEGHTDDLPSVVYADNDELSELRAESVMDWLVESAGIDAGIISAQGLGQDYPRADNDTDDGRQQNRRVVITVKPADGGQSTIDYELEDAEGQ